MCGAGVDHGHHGLPVGLGTGKAGLCSCQHTGGESNIGIGDHRPVRDQKGTAAGVKERLRQSRQAARTRGAIGSSFVTRRQDDPVGIELQVCDFTGSQETVICTSNQNGPDPPQKILDQASQIIQRWTVLAQDYKRRPENGMAIVRPPSLEGASSETIAKASWQAGTRCR